MAWITGSASNYQTLLDELFRALNRISVQTMAVNAGGTGYAVGDVLTVSGGTSTVPAKARVLTLGASNAVATVAVENSGVYTVAPATSAAATTGGTGSGCTLNTTNASNGWTTQRAANIDGTAQSATVTAGGTGYTVGDTLTVSGGTPFQAATFRVLTAPGGVAATVGLLSGGDYVATPSNAAATTGGTGTGCTLTVTYGTPASGTDREFISKGTGLGGTDAIFCGIRSYFDSSSGSRSWELAGFTGFTLDANGNPLNTLWANHPGISPGRYDGGTNNGAFVPLGNTTITYWLGINGRRVVGIFKIGTAYLSCYFGFVNPYATTGEYPYPIYISGCTTQRFALSTSSSLSVYSICNPQRDSNSGTGGPGLIRFTDGAWYSVACANNTGGTRTANTTGFTMWPCGTVSNATPTGADLWFNYQNPFDWSSVVPQTGIPGSQGVTIARTQGSPTLPPLFPCTILTNSPSLMVVGEIDNVFWLDGRGGIVTEDSLTEGTTRYRVFQGGNQTDGWGIFAVKEQ